jgi:Ca-activated chloride channel family protein
VIELLWPASLMLLGLVPVLVAAYVWSLRRRKPTGVRYSSLALLRDAAPGTSRLRRHLPFSLFALAVTGLVVALSRPVVIAAVPTNQTTIILALDVSRSMCSTDIAPSRLQAAEAAASTFIEHQAAATQIGIVAFGGFAELIQAPTTDVQTLINALNSLATGRRTAVGSGIEASLDAIAEIDPSVAPTQPEGGPDVAPVPQGAYAPDIIVLLTDGASNSGTPPLDAAQEAATRGVRVYTIGFGTAFGGGADPACAPQLVGREPQGGGFGGFGGGSGGFGGGFGSPGSGFRRGIDEATLQQIADLTGGEYYPAESASDLEQVFASLPVSLILRHEVIEVSVGFVALASLLTGLAFLLGRAWRPLP